MKKDSTACKPLTWDDVCYLYGGVWAVTLANGSEAKLNCDRQRGVGFRAISCFGYDAAQKANFTPSK